MPPTSAEPLAEYKRVLGATVEELDSLTTQPCGMDYYNGRLIVSDYTTGDIRLYSPAGSFTLLGTIATGLPGIMGVKIGPDGRIWFVNKTTNSVYRLDLANPAKDVSLTAITSPALQNFNAGFYDTGFNLCDGTVTPSVTIKNLGTSSISSIGFEYTIDGGSPVAFTWTGLLQAVWTVPVALPLSNVANGSHLLRISALTVNGGSDDILQNNVLEGSFRTINPAVPVPYTEGFDNTNFPPAGWNYIHYNPNNKMDYNAAGGFGQSAGCMKMDNFSGDLDVTGQVDYLMTPLVDMSTATSNSWLRFSVAYAKYNTSSNDALEVRVSTDCGNSWNTIYNKSGTTLSTAPNSTSSWTPTASQWRTDSVSLAAYSSQPEVLFMFTAISKFGNNLYIDDVFIGDIATGLEDAADGGFMNISPNPVSSSLHIHLENPSHETISGEILSAEGKTVYSFTVPSSQTDTELDISGLPASVYTLRLTDHKTVRNKLFVKQ